MSLLLALLLALQDPPKVEVTTPKEEKKGLLQDWDLSAQVYAYRVREDRDYLQPTIAADRAGLHLEARYNYEDRDTGSAWIGYNWDSGDDKDVKLEVTPMAGFVFGNTLGVAPGVKATLSFWKMELYTEYEYVIDFSDRDDNFSYYWSEALFYPLEWLAVGGVFQHTRIYQTDWHVQRGFIGRVFIKKLEVTLCYFNPTEDPVWVLGLGISF